MMKKTLTLLFGVLVAVSCDVLDTMTDSYTTQETLDTQYSSVIKVGYAQYGYFIDGLSELDGNIAAPKSDEAVQTSPSGEARYFNNGSWSPYYNPDNHYSSFYRGIRAANFFLENYSNYKERLSFRRDTLAENNRASWERDITNAKYLYAEAHAVKAYYYFELLKRYGGVPLYKSVPTDGSFLPRATYDEVADYAVSEIDACVGDLAPDWSANSDYAGRFDQGAAMALKSRILLFAASPLNTEGQSAATIKSKWEKAAVAADDVMKLGRYLLNNDYSTLFTGNTSSNVEIILSRRTTSSNDLEKKNYPIGTPGGNSGITPSGNLVNAYEYITYNPAKPFEGLDLRFYSTIIYDGCNWNGRTIDIGSGQSDSYTAMGASRTGYYLKKYLTDNLDIPNNQTAAHQWICFRYAEILLNYAEAANEVNGPDDASLSSLGRTPRDVLNSVRERAGLPGVDLSKYEGATDKDKFRNAIKAERRVEFAFEDHRYWDLLRWKDGAALSSTITGVNKAGGVYSTINVENRSFDESKMYRYPIPFTEISKSDGVLKQNQGW